MPVIATNRGESVFTLPSPLRGVVSPGRRVLLDCTADQLRATIPGIEEALRLEEVDGISLEYDPRYDPAGIKTLAPGDDKAKKRLRPRSASGTSVTVSQADEDDGVQTTSSSAVTVTCPQLEAGTQMIVYQAGLGQVTIVGGSGVSITAPFGSKSYQQATAIVLWWRLATEVVVSGQTTAV